MYKFKKISQKSLNCEICKYYNFCENYENLQTFKFWRKWINLRKFPQKVFPKISKFTKISNLKTFKLLRKCINLRNFWKKINFASISILAKMKKFKNFFS